MHSSSAAVAAVLQSLFAVATAQVQQLNLVAAWSVVEYEFPSDAVRQETLASQEYVPGTGVTIDMDVDYGGQQDQAPRIFVTVPRFIRGIPITFGTLTNQTGPGGPQIRAYPDYAWNANQGNNCDGFTSVFRVAIDDCRRLWVLDTGKIGNTNVQNCPPQLVAFDLDTDQVIQRYKFPENQYKIGSSLYITPVVDVRDATPATASNCPNTMVYIADVTGFGLLVYDLQQDRSWRVQNKNLYSAPHAGTFTIAGESFDLMDGVFGLALTPAQQATSGSRSWPAWSASFPGAQTTSTTEQSAPQQPGAVNQSQSVQERPTIYAVSTTPPSGERMLYFHALASFTEIAVPLSVLDNATLWDANVESTPRSFVEIGDRGIQAAAEAMDTDGNLFIGLIDPIGIGCWDSLVPYDRRTIHVVAQNDETLQFSSGLKVKRNRAGQAEVWVNTCRFQKVADGTISPNETNFRIQSVAVEQLLGGQRRCTGAPLA